MGNRKPLIQKIAEECIREFGVELDELARTRGAQMLVEPYFKKVRGKTGKMKPSTLGIIAAKGKSWGLATESPGTSLYLVHCGTWLGKRDSGRTLLRDIATTAIIAQMYDTLMERGSVDILGGTSSECGPHCAHCTDLDAPLNN